MTDIHPSIAFGSTMLDDSSIPSSIRLAVSSMPATFVIPLPPIEHSQLAIVPHHSGVSQEKKRKRDNDDSDDNNEGEQKDDYPKRFPPVEQIDPDVLEYMTKHSDHMEVEKRLCQGLMLFPTSQTLNGYLIVSLVKLSVSKRIRTLESCRARLSQDLLLHSYCLCYINVHDARTARYYLNQRDASLLQIFESEVNSARKSVEGKSSDQIAALLFQQAEKNQAELQSQIDTKKQQQVARIKKAAEKLSILSTSTASTSDKDNDPQFDKLVDDNLECVVCADRRRQICFAPCGHISVCQLCSIAVDECPICRTKIERKIKFIVS